MTAPAEDRPWFHLVARLRPHEPIVPASVDPLLLVGMFANILGPLDVDDVMFLPEVGTAEAGERRAWVRRTSYSGAAVEKRGFVSDGSGMVHLDEAFLGQLLLDAGWERTV